MDIAAILNYLQDLPIAIAIRDSLYYFPLLESAHVIGLAMVFGTVLTMDLRMMGVASMERPFRVVTDDLLKWTWLAFAVTLLTGALMFTTNATVYYHATAFRIKMLLLLIAGLNMAVFELTVGKRAQEWGKSAKVPRAARIAGIFSLTVWLAVIVAGRMIGFETSNAAPEAQEAPTDIDFDEFLEGLPDEPPVPSDTPDNSQ